MAKRSKQISFDDPRLKKLYAFGGELFKKRRGRLNPRPVSIKHPMHLVLKSSQAKGEFSFLRPANRRSIELALKKHSQRCGVVVLHVANVGNHLHLMLRFKRRALYKSFIRGFTAAIALSVGKRNRWKKSKSKLEKFWSYRPFTRIIESKRHFLTTRDYIFINELEGQGYGRIQATALVRSSTPRNSSG